MTSDEFKLRLYNEIRSCLRLNIPGSEILITISDKNYFDYSGPDREAIIKQMKDEFLS